MNNIVEKILHDMKYGVETGLDKYDIKVDGIGLQWIYCKELLDYITNLQEENEKLKRDVELFKNDLISCTNTGLSLITKIDKAIEYINTRKVSDTITFPLMKKEQENQVKNCFDYEFDLEYKRPLLNILQNGVGENK